MTASPRWMWSWARGSWGAASALRMSPSFFETKKTLAARLERSEGPKQGGGGAGAGMVGLKLPAGLAGQCAECRFALGEPLKVAIFEIAGLESFVGHGSGHAFENRTSVEWKCLFSRIENLQQSAADAAGSSFGERGLNGAEVSEKVRDKKRLRIGKHM